MNHTEIASGILKPLPESIRPHSLMQQPSSNLRMCAAVTQVSKTVVFVTIQRDIEIAQKV
jgi:hypothetical protein